MITHDVLLNLRKDIRAIEIRFVDLCRFSRLV